MARSKYKPISPPKGLLIPKAKAPAKIGSRIDRNRVLGFGTRQHIEGIASSIYGPARESQVGTQRISLGMGRKQSRVFDRLAQKANTGRIWGSSSARKLAVRSAKGSLRSKPVKLSRLRVN